VTQARRSTSKPSVEDRLGVPVEPDSAGQRAIQGNCLYSWTVNMPQQFYEAGSHCRDMGSEDQKPNLDFGSLAAAIAAAAAPPMVTRHA
jgi:hypothetical protein